jgi:nitroreductase
MTVTARLTAAQALRRAAARAALAPSIHNSQPWRFILTNGVLELHADRSRQLNVLDPASRQLQISCGCALFNARVALAAAGYASVVQHFPEPARASLLTQLSVTDLPPDPDLGVLDSAIELRHTNRRPFTDEPVPAGVVEQLLRAASAEDANLVVIRDEHVAAAVLAQRAVALRNADPAYRAELRAWSTDEPVRLDDLAAEPQPAGQQCLLVLTTATDNPFAWLRAGEALQRTLLELTRLGYVAELMSEVAEMPPIRAMLRRELKLTGAPHLLLRVGRAPTTPATRRRRLVEVLVEHL